VVPPALTIRLGMNTYTTSVVVLVCQLPQPALYIVTMAPNGATVINETVANSQVITLQAGILQLDITLDQLPNAIGLQVRLLAFIHIYFCKAGCLLLRESVGLVCDS